MRFESLIRFWILMGCALISHATSAVVRNLNPNPSYLEDTLRFSLDNSLSPLPAHIAWYYSNECNATTPLSAETRLDASITRIPPNSRNYSWNLPPGTFPGGQICVQVRDLLSDSALGSPVSMTLYSRSKHAIVSAKNEFPWTVSWQRPAGVPLTRVQIIEQSETEEIILSDFLTSSRQWDAGRILSTAHPQHRYRLRLANAFSGSLTQTDSWIAHPIRQNADTLEAPRLRSPQNGSSILRNQDSLILFLWSPLSVPCRYIAQLSRKQNDRWISVFSGETPDSSWTISASALEGGEWRWNVTAIHENGARGQSPARFFTVTEKRPRRFITLMRPSPSGTRPVSGAEVRVHTWDGMPTQSAYSSVPQGTLQLFLSDGPADIEIRESGLLTARFTREIPSGKDSLFWTLPELPPSILSGRVVNHSGLPLASREICLYNARGDTLRAATGISGEFALRIPEGLWTWLLRAADGTVADSAVMILRAAENLDLGTKIIQEYTFPLTLQFLDPAGKPAPGISVHIRDRLGNLSAQASADRYGLTQISLPQGQWVLSAHAQGWRDIRDSILLNGPVSRTYKVYPGSLVIRGRVYLTEEAQLDRKTNQYRSGIPVECVSTSQPDFLIKTTTDPNGEYECRIPGGGSWIVRASWSGVQSADTAHFRGSETTQRIDLDLGLGARINGEIHANGLQADSIFVHLWRGDTLIASALALRFGSGIWNYVFRNIPPGVYSLDAATQSWRSPEPVPVEIPFLGTFSGRGTISAPPIQMIPANQNFTIRSFLRHTSVQPIQTHWELLYPYYALLRSSQTISVPAGRIRYRMIPDTSGWLFPHARERFLPVDATGIADSIFFAAYHPRPAAQQLASPADTISLILNLYERVDSAYLWIAQDSGKWRKIPPKAISAERISFTFSPHTYLSPLPYRFEVFSAQGAFGNADNTHHYSLSISYPALPFRIQSAISDTIRATVGSAFTIAVSATAPSRKASYDAEILRHGQVVWISSDTRILRISPLANSLSARAEAVRSGQGSLLCVVSAGEFRDSLRWQFRVQPADSLHGIFTIQAAYPLSPLTGGMAITISAHIRDSAGKSWSVPASWTAEPSQAIAIKRGDSLVLDSLFIGPLRLIAAYAAMRDTLSLNVSGLIGADHAGRRWFHDSSVSVYIPDSAWSASQNYEIKLTRYGPERPLRSAAEKTSVSGSFFNLEFPQGFPRKSPYLEFRLQPNRVSQVWLVDSVSLQARILRDTTHGLRRIQPTTEYFVSLDTVSHDGISWLRVPLSEPVPWFYGLSLNPDSIKHSYIHIIPNPFSPRVIAYADGNREAGTSIRFLAYAPGQSVAIAQIQILNLSGEPVRTLLDRKTVPPTEQIAIWDGKDDLGNWVRNGRYLVLFTVRSSTSGKILHKTIHPVVVFK